MRQIIWQAAKNQWGDLAEAAVEQDSADNMTPEETRKAEERASNLARSKKTRDNNVQRILNYALGQEFRYRGMGVKIHMPEWAEQAYQKAVRDWRLEREAAVREGRPARRLPTPQTDWQIDMLIICQKELEEKLRPFLPANVATEHFGNLVGLDRYRDVPYCLVIGRPLLSPRDAELLAEVYYDDYIESIGDSAYDQCDAFIRVWGADQGPMVKVPFHPDPRAEAMRWEVAEGGVDQAVGRVRAANRTAANPVHIDVVCNLALPIEVDEVVEWGVAKGETDLWLMARKGFILFPDGRDVGTSACLLASDIWEKEQTYKDWRRLSGNAGATAERAMAAALVQAFSETGGVATDAAKVAGVPLPSAQSKVENANIYGPILENSTLDAAPVPRRPKPADNLRTFGIFLYRRTLGSRSGNVQAIGIDLAQHPDPRKALEDAFNAPLATFEVLHLPAQAAYDAIHSDLTEASFIERAKRYFAMDGLATGREMPIADGAPEPDLPEGQPAPTDPSELASPVPPGRRFVVRQTTAIGWDTWLYFPDAEPPVWTDLEFNLVTPPPAIREAGQRYANGNQPSAPSQSAS